MSDKPSIPKGYLKNAMNHLVPESEVRKQDLARDRVARKWAIKAIKLNAALTAFKKESLADIAKLVTDSGKHYGAKMGGTKGNVSIISYDGQYKIVRQYADRIAFTEEMEVAKKLVLDCVNAWSAGANGHLKAVVQRVFSPSKQGQIRTQDVLDLLRLEIDDDRWRKAMQAVKDSILVTGTAVYVRVYERIGNTDQYKAIPLDLAAV
ncbi:DUF3164 family protein [Pseudomonas schmalbachii]|uniref:DUF3164 family protein n=1 Tax=Pseudomonas schmalbachii TaxID=2816993 RepID=A0ABS3TKG1_9PSED|nr:DUF3164 family protein [Pseudomonas schmalbachii]MBO3274159.1 DUF3164 family protein [Pseudomonas schmalbachii]